MRSVGNRVRLGLDLNTGIESFWVNRVRLAAPYVAAVENCGCRNYAARDIDPRSLVLGGDGTIYWRRGGTVLSAPLRG